ncbi:MAG: prolipoprotein diacylglyceryl transferase [Clostridia bacterium]|jgi:phosphatidylglycerol:prolipoprotein diacylglycerol transferase|nr:prolipoprotein diacylglyceryl transferase [Clostridia bacterium]MDD4408327.1 prolipoprotein diacylglyceryl transferase [Clostridia bacterium]
MDLHMHGRVNFNLFGLEISAYGVIVGLGIIAGILIAIYLGKKRGFKSNDILTMALYVLPLAIIGARLYYVIFYDHQFSFIEFFQIWNGGIAILGAVIGGAIGIALYCLIHKKNLLNLTDIAAPSLILGQAIGRIGCYFGGCCFGIKTVDPALQWFPFSVQIDGVWHLSTFFYESFWCLLGFIALFYLFRKVKTKGVITCLYFVIYGIGRFIIETWRDDSLFIADTGIKVSQLLSGILVLLGISGLIVLYFKNRLVQNEVAETNEKKEFDKTTSETAKSNEQKQSNQKENNKSEEKVTENKDETNNENDKNKKTK